MSAAVAFNQKLLFIWFQKEFQISNLQQEQHEKMVFSKNGAVLLTKERRQVGFKMSRK